MPRGQREPSLEDNDGRADTERQRRERKRAQNRRSQQCFRERQAARIQELTDMVEELKKSTQATGGGEGESRVDLLKENQELRQALLSMRKSLLSLSSAAAFSADSDVLKRILNKPVEQQRIESPNTSSPNSDGTEEIPFVPMEDPISRNEFVQSSAYGAQPPAQLNVTGDTAQAFDALLNSDGFFEEMNRATSSKFKSNSNETPHDPLPSVNPDFSMDNLYNLMCGFPGPIIESDSHLAAIRAQAETPQPDKKKRPSGSSLLTLESVIEEVIANLKFHSIRERLEIPHNTLSLTPDEVEVFDSHTRAGVTSLAVRVFLKSTYLGGYTRVMGFGPLVESIMQWRMQPTPENRAKIPAPFTPTVLQQRFIDHNPAIDFVTWGDLRDQLLLYVNLSSVDLNKLLYDSIRCVVREFPGLQVAVPVLDTVAYMTSKQAAISTKSSATSNEIYGPGHGLDDKNLEKAIVDRIKSHGFNKLTERKLSPAFGVSYPFLDISSAVTTMPVVDYRSIQSCF